MAILNLCVDCLVDDHCYLDDPDCQCLDCHELVEDLVVSVLG